MSENTKIKPDISGIDEIKKDILPSNESQPVEEITTEQKRQQSLVDKFLNSPYIEKNHDLDEIFNSAEDSKYQINNLLNYYKKAQIEFLYTLTAYFQSDNDNNIYMSYPFSTLEHQITLYRIQFSEIERSIYNILLRNIISKRYIKNIFDGANIERMSELDEKKIEALIDGLTNIEMQSGGSGGSDENFNELLKSSGKSLSNKITNSVAEFINFKADVTIDRFVKEEIIIKEFTDVAKKEIEEDVLKGNFSLANTLYDYIGNDINVIVGGVNPDDPNELSIIGTDVNALSRSDNGQSNLAVTTMLKKNDNTAQGTKMNELATAIAKKYDFIPQTEREIRQNYEDLSVAVKSMSNPTTMTFTINSEQINIMISDEMKQFIDNVSKSSTPGDKKIEGEVPLDSKEETIKKFSSKFRPIHKSFIYKEIVKGSPVEDINTNLYNKFGNDGKVKINSLDGTEYQMLSELGITFETDIENNLKEIANDANNAAGSFIKTIRDGRNVWEEVWMADLQNMLSRTFTEEQSEHLSTAFNQLMEQSLTVIGTNDEEAKDKYGEVMNEYFGNINKEITKLNNIKEEQSSNIETEYLTGKTVEIRTPDLSVSGSELVPISSKPSVTITDPTMLSQPSPSTDTGKMVTTIAQTPAFQSEKTQLAIKEIPKIDNEIKTLQQENTEKQERLVEAENELFNTQNWLTKEEIKNSRKDIINDESDTSLINKVKNELKKIQINPEVTKYWLSLSMEEKEDSLTWTIPQGASINLQTLVGKLNIITGSNKLTQYDIIIETLTSVGTLLEPSMLTSSWTPERLDDEVKSNTLPSPWFSTPKDTTQETKNDSLNKMSIDDFDVTIYKEASKETQKQWIYDNWEQIRKKNADAKTQVTTPKYQQQLGTVIEEIGLIIINENKINALLAKKVNIQEDSLPKLLISDAINLQAKTLKAKEKVTEELAKDIMSRFKTMREALDTADNGININMTFKDEGGKRDYQFTINVYESDILNTLNSLKVTDSLLDIELSLLSELKEEKDKSEGYYDYLKNINIFSSKSNEQILEDIDFRIGTIKKRKTGLAVSIEALSGIYKNLGEFTSINGGDIPKHLAQLVNLNGTIPQLQNAVTLGYTEGLSLSEQNIVSHHRLISPDINLLKFIPEFKSDKFWEIYIAMNRLYTQYKLPLQVVGGSVFVTGGAIVYRSFDPAGALSQTVGAFITPLPGIMYAVGSGVVEYYPVAGISYLGLESLSLVPVAYSGLGRWALNRVGLEQSYNQLLYREAGLGSYIGVLPSRYSSDIDAGIYMNTMNTYRLTEYEAYQFWNKIPDPTTNGSTYIYHSMPPTQKDINIYQTYGGFNTSQGFIGNPNPGNLIEFPPFPTDPTDTDANEFPNTTISLAEKQCFALMEKINVGALAIGLLLFLWGQKKMIKKTPNEKKENRISCFTTRGSRNGNNKSITEQDVSNQLENSQSNLNKGQQTLVTSEQRSAIGEPVEGLEFTPEKLAGDGAGTKLPPPFQQEDEEEAERIEAAAAAAATTTGTGIPITNPGQGATTSPIAAAEGKKVIYKSVVKDGKPHPSNYDTVMNTLLRDNRTGNSKTRQGIITDLQGLETKFNTTIRIDERSIEQLVQDKQNYTLKKAVNDIQNLLKNLRDNGNEEVKEATKMQGGGLLKKKGSKKNKVEKKKGRKTKRKMYTIKKKGNSKKHKKKSKVKRNTRRK